ncbi:MAG: hypothetical protein ACO25B_02460 [Chitinophagaceae bacterium]
MPKLFKWAGLLAAALLVASAFLPWVIIESRGLVLTGVDTTGTNYGRPAYFHFVIVEFFVLFTLVARLWAKRANLAVVAINTAWAIRNFLVIASCQGGECPLRQVGLWLALGSSLLMLLSALFPDMEV